MQFHELTSALGVTLIATLAGTLVTTLEGTTGVTFLACVVE